MSYDQVLNTFLEKSTRGIPVAIVGTTGVGKTDLAWRLATAERSGSASDECLMVSVDSRQVFTDIPILSGADVPAQAVKQTDEHGRSHFSVGKCSMYGVSMLDYHASWSLGQFIDYARPLLETARAARAKVILVGGTGLYYEHLFSSDPAISVPPDEELRSALQKASVSDLQLELEKQDSQRLEAMNNSDRQNPRRLIRAIEIARAGLRSDKALRQLQASSQVLVQPAYIGLKIPDQLLRERIAIRVRKRFEGASSEVSRLLDIPEISDQLRSTLGFSELTAFIRGECSEQECIDRWIRSEWQYARSQMTWWKSHQNITWFDPRDLDLE